VKLIACEAWLIKPELLLVPFLLSYSVFHFIFLFISFLGRALD